MKKRIISLLACGAIAAGTVMGLSACGGGEDKMIVWGPATQQAVLQQMVDEFLAQNPDITIPIELGIVGEGDAYSKLSQDVEAGADVYAYANDQLVQLRSIGALAKVPDAAVTSMKQTDDAGAVESGKIGDAYYGYPYAADNGFFMYYNTDIVPAGTKIEDMTLNDILDACAEKSLYFIYQMKTGWYAGSFIYGAGGTYEVTWNGAEPAENGIACDFDTKKAVAADGTESEYTAGVIGAQMHYDLGKHDALVDGDDTVISEYVTNNKMGVAITGTWNGKLISENLGDKYAATILPDYVSSLDQKTYHWYTFAGYKLYGVNSYSKHPEEAHKLAQFLSSQAMQEKRFDAVEIGPSNKTVAAMDKVKNNVAIGAISKQFEHNYVIQKSMPSTYWSAMEAYGTKVIEWTKADTAPTTQDITSRVAKLVQELKGQTTSQS